MLEERFQEYSEEISRKPYLYFSGVMRELEEQEHCSDEDYVALYNVWRSSVKSEFYEWLKMMTNWVLDEDIRVAFHHNRTLKDVLTIDYNTDENTSGSPEDVDLESAFVRMEAAVGGELFVYRQGVLHVIDVDKSHMFEYYRFDLGRDFHLADNNTPGHRKSDMRNNIRFDLEVDTGYRSHNLSWFNGSQKLMRPRSGELTVIEHKGHLCFYPESYADCSGMISRRAEVRSFYGINQNVINHVLDREDAFWSMIHSTREEFYMYEEAREIDRECNNEKEKMIDQLEEELRLSRKKIEELEQLIELLRSDGFGSA